MTNQTHKDTSNNKQNDTSIQATIKQHAHTRTTTTQPQQQHQQTQKTTNIPIKSEKEKWANDEQAHATLIYIEKTEQRHHR